MAGYGEPWEDFAAPAGAAAAPATESGPWQDFSRPEVPLSGPSATPGIPAQYPAPEQPDPDRRNAIVHAFGQGFDEAAGTERLGFSDESIAALRKAGIFRGEGQNPIWAPFQAFNEAIMSPIAAALDDAWRLTQGVQKGTDSAAVKAGLPPPFDTAFDLAASMGFPERMSPPKPGTIPAPIRPIEGSPAPGMARSVAARTGIPEVDSILQSPVTSAAIDNAVIDRSHTVPYGAGGSVPLENPTVYIDKNVPKEQTAPRLSGSTTIEINGVKQESGTVTFDPAEPWAVHENVEQHTMELLIKGGMSSEEAYRVAHFEFAEPAEQAWYRAHDIDQVAAEKEQATWLPRIQHENATDVPKDLYEKPYPHADVQGAKHESVEEAKPSPEEIEKARDIIRNEPSLQPQDAVSAMQQARALGVIGPEKPAITEGTPADAAKAATARPGVQGPATDTLADNPWRANFDRFVSKLTTPGDVKQLIRNSADENDNFVPARQGNIPLNHIESIAQAAGVEPNEINARGLGRTLRNDNEVRVAMQLMIQGTENAKSAARDVLADGSPESLIKFQEALMRRDLAVEQIVGLRAEWGRTGNVFQQFMREVKDSETLTKFIQESCPL